MDGHDLEISRLQFPGQLAMGDVGRGWCHFDTFKTCGTHTIERWTGSRLKCVANRVELESRGEHGAGDSMPMGCKRPQVFCDDRCLDARRPAELLPDRRGIEISLAGAIPVGCGPAVFSFSVGVDGFAALEQWYFGRTEAIRMCKSIEEPSLALPVGRGQCVRC